MPGLHFSLRSHPALHSFHWLYVKLSVPYTVSSETLWLCWHVSYISSYILLTRTRLVEVNWLTWSTVSDMHSWSDHVFFWSIFPWRRDLYSHSVCPPRNFGPIGWFQSGSEGAVNQQRQPSMHRASPPGPESCTVSFALRHHKVPWKRHCIPPMQIFGG